MRRRARRHGLAGLAALGAVVIAGVVAGWGVTPVKSIEISPADVVALRFPADWSDDATGSAPAAAPGAYALASADSQPVDANVLFSPRQMAALPVASDAMAPMSNAEAPRTQPRAEAKPQTKSQAKTDTNTKPDTKAEAPTRTAAVATRSLAPAPEKRAMPRVKKDSGTLFNDAQLASIKGRLHLSPDQEQYWPAVEAALRDIGWRASHDVMRASYAPSHARLAEIDPDSPEVQRLKSAAFPLIMSMSEDQKREVRMLAQVMGLDRVAASF